ncbi:MAG: hypothetical protein ACI4C1_01955 [Lachnospiraceae bacterium]
MKMNKGVIIGIGAAVTVIICTVLGLSIIDSKNESGRDLEKTMAFSVVNMEREQSDVKEGETNLAEEENADIVELIKRYYATLAACDIDTLNDIVATTSGIDADDLRMEEELIEDYENIVCYIMDGLVNNTYIVYVYYEIKFVNIGTLAPGLSCMYVCRDTDNTVYINEELTSEIKTYMARLEATDFVQDLIEEVNNRMLQARRLDVQLDRLVKILNGERVEESDKLIKTMSDAH